MKSAGNARQRLSPAPAATALREHLAGSLSRLARQHRQLLRACRRHPSAKSLHDLRIESRRLLALVALWRALKPRPPLRKVRRRLKRLMKSTARLRDAQVQARLLKRFATRRHPDDFAAFGKYLKGRKRRAVRAAAKKLKTTDLPRVLSRLEQRAASLPASAADPVRARQALRSALETVLARLPMQRRRAPDDPNGWHRARVALKKLRYMAELLQPDPPHLRALRLARLHACQRAMGELHDLELFLARLEKFAARGKLQRSEVSPLKAIVKRRHAASAREQRRLARAGWLGDRLHAIMSPSGASAPPMVRRKECHENPQSLHHAQAA